MLLTKIYIYSPTAAVQPDEYNLDLYFLNNGKAKYLNLGDVIQDTANNQYQIVNAILPFSDGNPVTVKALGINVIPVEDSDYNSDFFTPGQKNFWPNIRTSGQITFSQLYSPENFEYSVSATWDNTSEANKAAVGTSIVAANGKEYSISYLDPVGRFTTQFRVVETHKTGELIVTGVASLYTPTANLKLFQGTELTHTARAIIRDRDAAIIDDAALGGGGTGPHDHDDRYYTEAEVDAIIAGIGGGTIKRNQTPLEAVDGSRLIFTLPNSDSYASNTLVAIINGLRESDVVELSSTTFQVSNPAPEVGDVIRIDYVMP